MPPGWHQQSQPCASAVLPAQHSPPRIAQRRLMSAESERESDRRELRASDEIRAQADAIRALMHDMSATPKSVGLDWALIDENLSLFSDTEREMMGCISQLDYDEPCSESEELEHKLSRVMTAGVQRPRGRRVRGSRGGRRGRGRRLQAKQCEQSASVHGSVDHRQSQPAHASRVSDSERLLEALQAGVPPHQWQEWLQIQPAPHSVPDALADQWWCMPPVEDPWEQFDQVVWDEVEAEVGAQLHSTPAQPQAAQPEAAQPEPVQPEPAQPEPAQPEPAQPEPAQPEPAQPEPVQREPASPEPAYEPYEAEAAAFSPGGTALDGYSPYEPESIASRVHARHAPPEPESVGGRVHARHAAAYGIDDDEMPCMF